LNATGKIVTGEKIDLNAGRDPVIGIISPAAWGCLVLN
jgi:hypothetical protein